MNPINYGLPGALLLTIAVTGCAQAADPAADETGNKPALVSEIDQASYLVGYSQAQSMAQQSQGAISMQAFLAGVSDQVNGAENRLADVDAEPLFAALQAAVQAKQAEASGAVRAAGDAFRARYAEAENVTRLASGLLYEVLQEGTGARPGLNDTVTTHYHGTLIDGTVFDSSVNRGQPASFPVNGVIAGWTEALQLMPIGSKWKLVIPPELAYGERGAGNSIPPHATLIFEVELLSIAPQG